MPLTDTAIKALKPKDKAYKVFDGGGLYLEVLTTGVKSWRYKYRVGGREKRLTLGQYPNVSLRDARAKMLEAKAILSLGADPSLSRGDGAEGKSFAGLARYNRVYMRYTKIFSQSAIQRTCTAAENAETDLAYRVAIPCQRLR